MNGAPRGERITIGFFGRRNVGKSSLINAFASQDISIVSDAPGTTTDPVTKAMELLPAGAVTLIDTPGSDDDGILGRERVSRTMDVLRRVDVAVLVTDGGIGEHEKRLMALFEEQGIPYLTVHSKCDML
ncbi:MAG: 50S ribosome-binding GTPase, partial [Oscillospiraceae bacterium]|nr:50S ribosome-binding GTPase [Oscillospiraceae bacterium]